MGNFALDDSYEMMIHMAESSAEIRKLMEIYNWKPDPDYLGYGMPVDSRKTIIVKCVLNEGGIERVSFLPAYINRNAEPEIMLPEDNRFDEVIKYMRQITQSQGLNSTYTVKGTEVVIR